MNKENVSKTIKRVTYLMAAAVLALSVSGLTGCDNDPVSTNETSERTDPSGVASGYGDTDGISSVTEGQSDTDEPSGVTSENGDPVDPPVTEPQAAASKKPLTRDNIIINAYLVQLQNEELRRSQMEYMKQAEIDVVSHVYVDDVWTAQGHTFDKYVPIMNDAADYGLKIYSRDYRAQTALNRSDKKLQAIAEEYRGYDGFAGFYVVDEPYDPNPYARVENAFRSVLPDCFININFLPRGAYPEGTYYKRLTDFGSLVTYWGTLSLDVYAFNKSGGVDEYQLFKNYDDLRRAALDTGMNTAVYVQSVGYVNYRRPSAGDLRYNMMSALAYGVKELKFFTWNKPWGADSGYTDAIFDADKQPTDLYYAVCEINKKIHVIGRYLASGDAVAVYHTRVKTAGAYEAIPEDFPVQAAGKTDAIISVTEGRDGGDQFLMIVNKDFKKAQTTSFSVGELELLLVDDVTGELKAAPVSDGVLTLELEAGDCALLKVVGTKLYNKVSSDDPNLAISAMLTATSAAGDGSAFLCNLHDGVYDDGAKGALISEKGSAQYVTLDLGAVKSINRVDLYPGGKGSACFRYFPDSFDIIVSVDGISWQKVVSETDFDPDKTVVPVFRFPNTDARYVRVEVSGFKKKDKERRAEFGEIAVYNDDGGIPDNIPTLYRDPGDNVGESVEDGGHSLAADKKTYGKGERIIITASGEPKDYLVFYPVNYVPGKDAGVYYACFDNTVDSRTDWPQLENGQPSDVFDWCCATPNNPQVSPFIDIPEGDYKVVMRNNSGNVLLEVFLTVEG
ncbi:MAG: discoidin domain-containing protein [Clostridia bacterium]|nr:discoidin domain-containing protein [Clostridia bacterium]